MGAGDLPGRERCDRVVSAKEVCAGFVVDRIGEVDWNGQVEVASADQILAVDIHVGDSTGETVGEFALPVEAGLMHARCDEVGENAATSELR